MKEKVDVDNFLPSSRSIAFKKEVWRKVGGYPEWLNACEDLVFAKKAKEKGFRFKTELDALAYWPQRKNFKQAFKQFFSYAIGDGTARFIRLGTPFLYGRYILGTTIFLYAVIFSNLKVFVILIILFFLYLIWSILKNYKYVKQPSAIFFLPSLQLISDLAVLFGTSLGFVKSFFVNR